MGAFNLPAQFKLTGNFVTFNSSVNYTASIPSWMLDPVTPASNMLDVKRSKPQPEEHILEKQLRKIELEA